MEINNRAAYMVGLNKMEIRDISMPVLSPEQVMVRLEYVGICGSDVHYFEYGRINDFVVNGDFILGHECSGTIVAVGEKVNSLKVGDRVALEPGVPCGTCEYCRTGNYNLCPDVKFLATPPYHGCFQNYIVYPEHMAFKLPDSIPTRDGALIEPLCVGLEAARQGEVTLGSSVVILGAGCIGLTALLACKAHGATDITVVDILPNRLEKAIELGATRILDSSQCDIRQALMEKTNGEGADIVIETAGAVVTTQHTPYLVKRGGTIVLVGMAPQSQFIFDFGKLMDKVAKVKTVFRYKNLYPTAIQAISSGLIDISKIVTNEFPFEQISEAFDMNIKRKNEVVKVVVKM